MLPLGCKIYVYIDSETVAMNGNHSYIGYFAGYPYNMKGFNVYSPTRRNVYECFHIKANTRIFYKDEWGPHKKLTREVNNEIVLMSKEDAMSFDAMEESQLKDFTKEFKLTEEGRLEAKSQFEQPKFQPNLSTYDPELNKVLPISDTPAKVDVEEADPNFTMRTPAFKQARVESNLFDEVISPDAQPIRKSARIEQNSHKLGSSGYTNDQAQHLLGGIDGKTGKSLGKSCFSAMSNGSMLMTMTALTMAIGTELSYPNKTVALLAEFDVANC